MKPLEAVLHVSNERLLLAFTLVNRFALDVSASELGLRHVFSCFLYFAASCTSFGFLFSSLEYFVLICPALLLRKKVCTCAIINSVDQDVDRDPDLIPH